MLVFLTKSLHKNVKTIGKARTKEDETLQTHSSPVWRVFYLKKQTIGSNQRSLPLPPTEPLISRTAKALPRYRPPPEANPPQNAHVSGSCSPLPEDPLSPSGAHRPVGLSLPGAEPPPPPNRPPKLGTRVPRRGSPSWRSSDGATTRPAAPQRRSPGSPGPPARRAEPPAAANAGGAAAPAPAGLRGPSRCRGAEHVEPPPGCCGAAEPPPVRTGRELGERAAVPRQPSCRLARLGRAAGTPRGRRPARRCPGPRRGPGRAPRCSRRLRARPKDGERRACPCPCQRAESPVRAGSESPPPKGSGSLEAGGTPGLGGCELLVRRRLRPAARGGGAVSPWPL